MTASDRELRAVAYRILGSLSETDDAVQEAWLRLRRTDPEQIDSLERWLTTVVARICLNMLRSRRTRGEQPLDGLQPEPIIDNPAIGTDPEHQALPLLSRRGLVVTLARRAVSSCRQPNLGGHDGVTRSEGGSPHRAEGEHDQAARCRA